MKSIVTLAEAVPRKPADDFQSVYPRSLSYRVRYRVATCLLLWYSMMLTVWAKLPLSDKLHIHTAVSCLGWVEEPRGTYIRAGIDCRFF